jgi:hypothetical protein
MNIFLYKKNATMNRAIFLLLGILIITADQYEKCKSWYFHVALDRCRASGLISVASEYKQ